jgi:mannose-6-phosphate isomerase-like protein (cupin superfamily)
MIYRKEDTTEFDKQGVKMRVYNSKEQCPQAAVVYQETQKGHLEEFFHSKSHFIFYIIEGEGTWYIEDKPNIARAGDVIIIPPNHRFYYTGSLKQICITSPSWEAEYEHHVKNIAED